jgi:predicted TIM-barrel fold metal-dependent hydrolase
VFGSDWPVLTLAGGYKTWMDTFRSFIAQLSPDEQESIRRGAGIAAYRL